MKTAIIIFVGGLLGLISADYFGQLRPHAEIHRQKTNHPLVKAHAERMQQAIDLSGDAVVTKTQSVGYINQLKIYPGFRVTHNPQLGKEVLVTAPEKAFNYLNLSTSDGTFHPDFPQPVRLSKLVEIELNLEKHGSKEFTLIIYHPFPGRTNFAPDFATMGPLSFQLLRIYNIPNHKIDIDSEDVIISSSDDHINLYGKAVNVAILSPVGAPDSLPNLQYEQLYDNRVKPDTTKVE